MFELIETLWNVNIHTVVLLRDSKTGINRNIVECKYRVMERKHLKITRINRNIVECK